MPTVFWCVHVDDGDAVVVVDDHQHHDRDGYLPKIADK